MKLAVFVLAAGLPGILMAQAPTWPERAIRHDIPITNSFRKALAAGSRDSKIGRAHV